MLSYSGYFFSTSGSEEVGGGNKNVGERKKAKSFKQKDDHSQQRPTPLCLLDHNTELQSNKAGEEGGQGKFQINQLQNQP